MEKRRTFKAEEKKQKYISRDCCSIRSSPHPTAPVESRSHWEFT